MATKGRRHAKTRSARPQKRRGAPGNGTEFATLIRHTRTGPLIFTLHEGLLRVLASGYPDPVVAAILLELDARGLLGTQGAA